MTCRTAPQGVMAVAVAAALMAAVTPVTAAPPAPSKGSAGAGGAVKQQPSKRKWSVDAPPGAPQWAKLDARRGTWMSVSVHPSGKKLCFDLLGDIYELPIQGGDATPLTSGMSWDMQPTYSPDGSLIAFTSDRSGGDNIYLMSERGKHLRPLTSERFRLLSQPTWSPDGRFVAARKHFTSRRSLGAGEIWLYYRTGGKGVQMTRRKQQQKDLGEPVFSPGGKHLYFSRDATAGGRFQYNKDPNPQIFAIERLERDTGKIERFLGGPGGATRPTPSPDGQHLAYLRRVRGATVLYVRHLQSGSETALYNGMDRDLQETWSIHGTYPALSWMPDSRSIVFWAHGELLRAHLQGRVTKIPFHVKGRREVRAAIRFQVPVDPDRVPLKMLRWVRASPDGKQVVFEALGKLWVRSTVGGKARRLTRQQDAFELMPSWSRDGKRIVFATWHDRLLGSLRVVDASGGKARQLTRLPGHYVEPAFSPDGKLVVYRKTGGGWLRSARWSSEPGVYVLDLARRTSRRVARKGVAPHFGSASDRIYLALYDQRGKGGKEADLRQKLVSVSLRDRRARVHATAKWARAMRVSPDGRWLAFQARYHVFVMPFSRTALPMTLAHDSKAWPTVKVSADAGDFLHWSGDSSTLRWALGPRLFSRSLEDAFAVLHDESELRDKGALERAAKPAPAVDLAFTAPALRHRATVAIVGARIVTMKGDEVIADGTIVWRGARIIAVGKRGQVMVPVGARKLEGKGLTVIPGLVDVHAHGAQATRGITPQQNWGNLSNLSFGITTIHDPSNDTWSVFAARQMQRAGVILAPRIFSTGTILYGARHFYLADVDSLDDARRHIRRMKAVGAHSVKSYNQPRRDQRQMLLQAARELGMMVVPEGGALFMHNMTHVVDGHTGVEHAIPLARGYDDVVQLWSATRVGYTPTLGVAYGGLGAENYWYAKTRVDQNKRLLRFVPQFAVDPKARRPRTAPDEEWNHIEASRFANRLMKRGVRVNLGAHGQREGLAAHWELWSFVQGGMTALEAIRACTIHPAWYVGLDRDIGSLEVGKLADMAVIAGDVLGDIRRSERVKWTVLGGRVFDAATMQQLEPPAPKRPPLFWRLQGEPRASARGASLTVGCGCHRH